MELGESFGGEKSLGFNVSFVFISFATKMDAHFRTRDRTSLDITWIKDQSLSDSDSLPDPADLARELVDDLEAGLASFKLVKDLIEHED